jgi:hypothetical protein
LQKLLYVSNENCYHLQKITLQEIPLCTYVFAKQLLIPR